MVSDLFDGIQSGSGPLPGGFISCRQEEYTQATKPAVPQVCSAGNDFSSVTETTEELWDRTIGVNLKGVFLASKFAIPEIIGSGGGAIINTASIAAMDGQRGQAAYAASKGGVAAMTLPAARELARSGIRVMCIAPGIFETPMMAGMPDVVQESLGRQVPFPPRLGEPDQYADTVAFIYGNSYVNGETIRVDGAIRMQPK